ncbi:hypothetical protein GTA08_BOTSDO01121 [Botryosphaeria dothidea]|uniref:Uncharacterized protein n=1 Tax=Botryosphaeria dothidea TaxID=55169 RepID=A0A8H4NG64_9PEZI|nr:hypothetical protein GTA08_BOTSDO01121 [Botryosphaeria dothidea]
MLWELLLEELQEADLGGLAHVEFEGGGKRDVEPMADVFITNLPLIFLEDPLGIVLLSLVECSFGWIHPHQCNNNHHHPHHASLVLGSIDGPDNNLPTGPDTLEQHCTDFAVVSSVAECQSESIAWRSRLWDFQSTACDVGKCSTTVTGAYLTGESHTFYPTYTGNLTTLCDGVPRATGEASPTITTTMFTTSTIYPSFSEAPPKCTYNPRGCELLVSASVNGLYPGPPKPTDMDCLWGPNCMLPKEGKFACRVGSGEMKVFYWPVSKDEEWLCTRTKNALGTPTPTSPPAGLVTAVYEDMTFTSPSIYMSFQSLEGYPCVLPLTRNVWLSAPPESFSSVVFKPVGETRPTTATGDTARTTVPLTWADMDYPVPAATYKSMRDCQWWRADNCSTIFDDYKPDIVMPTNPAMFTHLDPRAANCTAVVWNQLVLDPPIPLTTAGALLPPGSAAATTTNGHPESITTSAAPVTETTAPFAPSTASAGFPTTAPTAPTNEAGHDAGGSNPQPTGPVDPPASSDPSHDGSNGNDSSSSDPWGNLGSIISGIWGGGQPTAADPNSADPTPTTTTGQNGGDSDPPSSNNNGGGQQQPQPNSGNNENENEDGSGSGSGLPVIETIAPAGNNDPNNQAATLAPVVVTIGTALASAVPSAAANPSPNGNQGESSGNNNAAGGVVIGTQTLTPGHTTLIDSHTVVIVPTGGAIVVDGTTSPLYTGAPASAGGSAVVAIDPSNSSGVLVGGQPLAPGTSTTVNGVPVVVPASGGAVVIGGETHALPTATSAAAAAVSGIAIAPVDPEDPSKGVVIGGSATLTPGASTTIGGKEVVVPAATGGASGAVVVIDGQTYGVPTSASTSAGAGAQGSQMTVSFSAITGGASAATGAIVTLANGDETLTATPIGSGTVVLGGSTTLSVGGSAVTMQGSVVSMVAGGLVVADPGGLGGLIAEGLGGGATGSSTGTANTATDGGETETTARASSTSPSGSATATSTRTAASGDGDPLSTASASATRTQEGETTTTASAAGVANGPLPAVWLSLIFFTITVIPFISLEAL